MKSAITLSLVPQAKGGPFVFWDGLESAAEVTRKSGFDGLEIFAPSPQAAPAGYVSKTLANQNLQLAAVGTGACWVVHRWTLTAADPGVRGSARAFIRDMIGWGAELGAPAIIGSAQGRHEGETPREQALDWLADALQDLAGFAEKAGTCLLLEPLNRYETNLINRLEDGVALLQRLRQPKLKLLADLFHMNIEEVDTAAALQQHAQHLGHVHLADSNRGPCGSGHLPMPKIGAALRTAGYAGFVSAECLPLPNSHVAAEKTITGFKQHFIRP